MRSIPDPGFAGDDGAVEPEVAAALAAYDAAIGGDAVVEADLHHAALAVLQDARVLVPVVALLGEVEHDVPPGGRAESRLAHDKTSDMAAVLLTGRDGRAALLAFTSSVSMTIWNPDARPVPVTTRDAARAALQDEAAALLVDVAGPAMFVIEAAELSSLAEGLRLVRMHDAWAWVRVPA